MLRKSLKAKAQEKNQSFHLRGLDHTRIEGLSDGVFAIAIALLLISSDVPEKFSELKLFLKDFLPFAATITLLMVIWYQHYIFFFRFGLRDASIVAINTILLFLILFYVYPLKFLFKTLATLFTGLVSDNNEMLETLFTETITPSDSETLMVIYGFGAASIFFTIALMYYYAYLKRESLDLDKLEVFETKTSIGLNLIMGVLPFISMLIAFFRLAGDSTFMISGFIYWLYPIAVPIYSTLQARRRKKILQA